MKKIVILIFAVLSVRPVPGQAQEVAVPDSAATWMPSLIAKATTSQVGFQNWAEGGINTLGFNLGLDGKLEKAASIWSQAYEMRLAYGMVKQDTLDLRKSEDIIRLAATLQYLGEGFFSRFSPTVSASFRSQFAPGYNYQKNPFGDGRATPVKVSDFMNPGTFQQSLGLTYTPTAWFKQRFGVGAKETVILEKKLRVLYGVDADKEARIEVGLESFTEFDRDIAKNVHFKSILGLFAAFNQADSPDALWENFVTMKVNSWLNVNFEWVVLYDSDVSSKAQFKEVFAVGVSYVLL